MKTFLSEILGIFIFAALLSLILFGCGVDPDDYQAKKSDGCPSSGCVKEVEVEETASPVVAEVEPTTVTEPAKISDLQCAEGKLCKSMSQSAATLALPKFPDSATTYGDTLVMRFLESTWTNDLCALDITPNEYFETTIRCSITFKNSKLVYQTGISAKYLDLGSF